ncbi:MAG: hypothetical protein ACLUVZ_17090 [Bacteroides stercoris]
MKRISVTVLNADSYGKKKETDENTGLVRQFDDMKKKHPDAMLLFRTGDF